VDQEAKQHKQINTSDNQQPSGDKRCEKRQDIGFAADMLWVDKVSISVEEMCKDKDLTFCICKAQDERRSPEIGCRDEESCYVCWRCGKYFPYSRITVVETLRCPCCGYRIIAKARLPTGRAIKAI
jgi:DNA-directed RNA polymerase subunit RPC12/RpoP